MHLHAGAGLLVPDRREIDNAFDLVALRRNGVQPFVHGPGIHAPGPEVRQALGVAGRDEIEVVLFARGQNFGDQGDRHVAVDQPLDKAHFHILLA